MDHKEIDKAVDNMMRDFDLGVPVKMLYGEGVKDGTSALNVVAGDDGRITIKHVTKSEIMKDLNVNCVQPCDIDSVTTLEDSTICVVRIDSEDFDEMCVNQGWEVECFDDCSNQYIDSDGNLIAWYNGHGFATFCSR